MAYTLSSLGFLPPIAIAFYLKSLVPILKNSFPPHDLSSYETVAFKANLLHAFYIKAYKRDEL